MRVLIAGCGYVGTELGAQLVRAGHTAWGLRRRPANPGRALAPPGQGQASSAPTGELQWIAADMLDAVALQAVLPPALDAVVYAASASASGVAAYRAAYVDGPRTLLDALGNSAVGAELARPDSERARPVFVFVSSTGVYGQANGEWVDEASPAEPVDATARVLLEGEAVVRACGLRHTIVRLGGIYGPGRTSIVESVRVGRATIPAGAPAWTNRIHRDDAAGALAHVLTLADPAPLYVGVDTEPATLETVFTWLAARLGVPPPARGGPADATPGRGNKRCSSALLRASGYTFRYPTFREGYDALIADGA